MSEELIDVRSKDDLITLLLSSLYAAPVPAGVTFAEYEKWYLEVRVPAQEKASDFSRRAGGL